MTEKLAETSITGRLAWKTAADNAQSILMAARDAKSPLETDALTRLAYAWIEIAKLYKS